MPVVVSRSAKIKSRVSTSAAVLLLFASVLQLGNFFALRGLRRSVDDVPSVSLVEEVVLRTMDNWASSNRFVRAGDPSFSSSSVSSPSSSVSSSPRFLAVSDFSTWVDPSTGRYRARVDGVDCGEGDFLSFGLVLSIRPGRIICRSDDGLLILGRVHRSVGTPLPLGNGGSTEDAPPLG